MPSKKKKPPRNAYYFFMLEMKAEMQAKMLPIPKGMADVADYAKPRWEKLSKEEQDYYRAMAKEAKGKEHNADHIYDSTGRSFADLDRELECQKSAEERMNRNIEGYCRNAWVRNTLETEKFYFVYFNYHCKLEDSSYVPCEMSLLQYSLKEGIMNHYHCFIDPMTIPVGYKYDCIKHSEDTHKIPVTNFELADDNYIEQIIRIESFLDQDEEQCTYQVYTMPDHMDCAQKILNWLLHHSGNSEDKFQVYSLPKLLYELRKNAPDLGDSTSLVQKFPSVGLAQCVLEKDVFMYTPNISCPWHERQDEPQWCTLSVVKRYAFIISDYCCPCFNIPLKPKKHCPELADISPYQAEGFKTSHQRQAWNDSSPFHSQHLGARSKLTSPSQDDSVTYIQQGRSYFNPKQEKEYIMGATAGVVTERPVYKTENNDSDDEPLQPLRQPKSRGMAAAIAPDQENEYLSLTDQDCPPLGGAIAPRPSPWGLGRGQPAVSPGAAALGVWGVNRVAGRGSAVERQDRGPSPSVMLPGVGRGRGGLMSEQFHDLKLN